MIEDNNNYYCKACFKHEDSIDLPDHLKSSKVGNTGVFSKTQEKLGYIKSVIKAHMLNNINFWYKEILIMNIINKNYKKI